MKITNILCLIVLTLSIESASAYQITQASYDLINQVVSVDVTYNTCRERPHSFNWNFDACDAYAFSDQGLAVRLDDPEDITNPDSCDNPKAVTQTVQYSLLYRICPAPPYRLSIFIGTSHREIWIN